MRPRLILLLLVLVALGGVVFVVLRHPVEKRATTIRVLGEDSSNLRAFRTIAAAFERKTGVRVEFQEATFEQVQEKADQDFRGKTGLYDIVLQYNFSLAPYVGGKYVYPITDPIFDAQTDKPGRDFFPNALRETSFYYGVPHDVSSPPAQFGYPFAANTIVLVYNAELFSAADIKATFQATYGRALDVPTTWENYLDTARLLDRRRPGLHGVAVEGAAGGWLYYEVATYLRSLGTGVYKKDSGWQEGASLVLESSENEKALEYLAELVQVSAGDIFTTDALKQRELILDEKAAMGLVWSDYLLPFTEARDAEGQPKFAFAPIPGKVSPLAGGAFYINRASSDPRRAMEFIRYLLDEKNQEAMMKQGLCSPLRSAYTADTIATVPYAKSLRDSLERGVYMFEAGSSAQVVSDSLTAHVQSFLRKKVTAAQALHAAASEIRAAPGPTF